MSYFLKIDSRANVALTNRLEKLHKSDLPAAVRNTLNKAAFDMKKRTLLQSAERNFEKRQPNFFRANSRVEMARGNNISTMKAIVGFTSMNAPHNRQSVLDLQEQEFGGSIHKRSLLPTDKARVNEDYSKMLKKEERIERIMEIDIIDASEEKGSTRKQKYLRASIRAMKRGLRQGRLVKAGLNKKMIYRINSVKRTGGKTVVNSTPVYSVRKGRSVGIKATRFVYEALSQTGSRLNRFFQQEAQRRFDFRLK